MTDEREFLQFDTAPALHAGLPVREWLVLPSRQPRQQQQQQQQQQLELATFLRIGAGIANALADLHMRSTLHGDLRPENILIDPQTGTVQLRAAPARHGASGRAALEPNPASWPYMAPEQTGRMNRTVDARSDLYACGVSLYELLTGQLPFMTSSPSSATEWVHSHIAKPPVRVASHVPDVPPTLAQLIEKLLAKEPEARYQTAAGLEADLRRCLVDWERAGHISSFALGADDVQSRPLQLDRLYGRAAESGYLLAALERVANEESTELLLISGYSGLGKSAVVKELDRALESRPGLFAAGKFDQYQGHVPYAPLSQAFGALLRSLLIKPEAELVQWRGALQRALADYGRLVCELAPELELIIGPQPAVPALPPQNARPRLYRVLRHFLGVFARPEHPLVLFLDDLQWLDGGTLDFIEHLVTDPDARHTLVIGAYRSNEVTADHPLLSMLERIRGGAGRVGELALQSLTVPEVSTLLADGLAVPVAEIEALAAVIVEKTGGNPFFAIQFTRELLDSGALAYDPKLRSFHWELARVHEKHATDNIVDLVLLRVERLSPDARRLLAVLACHGRAADAEALASLTALTGTAPTEVATTLAHAVRLGLVSQSGRHYGFVHDRVEEAAYQLMPAPQRAELHLQIGRSLLTNGAAAEHSDGIFEVVNHLQRGSTRMRDVQEQVELARLHLVAGKRAKAASDFATARDYLAAGEDLLQRILGDAFHEQPELAAGLARHRAECEWLVGELETAEVRLAALSGRVTDLRELAVITTLRLEISLNLGRFDLGVQLGLAYLERAGHAMPLEPSQELLADEYRQILELWRDRALDTPGNLPALQLDAPHATTLEVIRALQACALFGHYPWLHSLLACRTVLISLVHGHVPASAIGYVILAMTVGPRFGDYEACQRFGRFALELVEHYRLDRLRPVTLLGLGSVIMPWGQHLQSAVPYLREGLESALRIGDINVATSGYQLVANYLAAGRPLAETERETQDQLALSQRLKFWPGVTLLSEQLRLVRCLHHEDSRFPELSDETRDEAAYERTLASGPSIPLVTCWYWIRKLKVRVIAHDYAPALEAAHKARELLWVSPSNIDNAEHAFYAALAQAGVCGGEAARPEQLQEIADYHRSLQRWAEHCPANFEHRALLVSAELARLQSDELAAQKLYERAIRAAEQHGFAQVEALANELAARFYAASGNRTVAHAYLRQALAAYQRWGAAAKVAQLTRQHPFLAQTGGDGAVQAGLLQIDLATVIRASSAIAQELMPEHVATNVLKVALEHSGAQRCVLLLSQRAHSDQLIVVARADTGAEGVSVELGRMEPASTDLPAAVLRYVARTKQRVLLDDASLPNAFSGDDYLRSARCRSLLCLPLVKLTQLVGTLYLENNLSTHVFAPKQIALLELLASQAALSLDHAQLYADLRKSREYMNEAERLSRTGTFSWKPDTHEIFWSDEVFRILGATGTPTVAMVRERIHPEDRARFDAVITGHLPRDGHGREYRLIMPDGATKHISVAAHETATAGQASEYVGAVRDVTELKQSESALQRTREALADVARVASLGEMSAAIAHEVNQPLAAIGMNASTCLRWLRDEQLNVAEARAAATRIARDATRAAEVIRGLRELFSRSMGGGAKSPVDLNEALGEVVALTRSQIHGHGAVIHSELAHDLPLVVCDRVQLQQVVVNLLLNAAEAMREVHDRAREIHLKTVRCDPEHVRIEVADTGPGLAAEHCHQIFRPFQTTKRGGMGMGLSICKSIVESHGGSLGVNSQLGIGSTFEVSLPLLPPS